MSPIERNQFLSAGALSVVIGGLFGCYFAPIGFHPTDEGFTLAISARILRGELPHWDFMSVRPVGSPLLHALWLGISGATSAVYFSRIVAWILLVFPNAIATFWFAPTLTMRARVPTVVVVTCICAHTFPIMAWHTIDGLALASAGCHFGKTRYALPRFLGGVFLAWSLLCKQSFAPSVVFAVVAMRSVPLSLGLITGLAAYLVPVIASPAEHSLVYLASQLFAHSGSARASLLPLFETQTILGCILILGAIRMMRGSPRSATVLLVAAAFIVLVALSFHSFPWAFVAAAVCVSIFDLARLGRLAFSTGGHALFRMVPIALALSAAISIGYPTPLLGLGPLLIAHAFPAKQPAARQALIGFWTMFGFVAALVYGRQHHELRNTGDNTENAGRCFISLENIRTSKTMSSCLCELRRELAIREGQSTAVMHNHAFLWIERDNYLPTVWPIDLELPTYEMFSRVVATATRLDYLIVPRELSPQSADVRSSATEVAIDGRSLVSSSRCFEVWH